MLRSSITAVHQATAMVVRSPSSAALQTSFGVTGLVACSIHRCTSYTKTEKTGVGVLTQNHSRARRLAKIAHVDVQQGSQAFDPAAEATSSSSAAPHKPKPCKPANLNARADSYCPAAEPSAHNAAKARPVASMSCLQLQSI